MSNKPWIKSYPEGAPEYINPDEYSSLVDLFESSFEQYADRVAFTNMGKSITFKEIDRLSAGFGAYLTHVAGLKPGDKVAVQMPNLLQYPVVMLGALRAGLVVVNTNPLYTPKEMEHQFVDSGARAIVILANFASNLEEIVAHTSIETVIVTEIGDLLGGIKSHIVNFVVKNVKKMVPPYQLPGAVRFKDAMKRARGLELGRPEVKGDDLAFLQYTGGTTGVSKGAMLTHRNLVANLEQVHGWMGHGGLSKGNEVFITALPLYHIFALTVNCLVAMRIGAQNVLITNPRDMKAFIKDLGKYPFTIITGVNTLFNGLLNQDAFGQLDFSSLKFAFGGGMAVQKAVAEKWQKVTGAPLSEGYGLTETSPVLTANPLNGDGRIGYIGLPVANTEIELHNDAGEVVGFGEPGELCAKGPQVMKGYWNRPDETALCLDSDGWLKTGDIAVMDEEGFLRIVDRKKEMILVSGFNVYPNEVEEAIAQNSKVLEVGVIGVPDSKSNEAVKAYVVKKDPSLTEEEVKEHCKELLTNYKRPKHVEFTDELPKSNVGKILRRVLKEKDASRVK